jgi:replicative DNA helicase
MDGDRSSQGGSASRRPPAIENLADELPGHERRLSRGRGRGLAGMAQVTLPTLDHMTNGLRGLILLAGGPGVGKTSLALQLGLDAVLANGDVGLLFVTLETSRWELISRLRSRMSALDWAAITNGLEQISPDPAGDDAGIRQLRMLQQGDATLAAAGDRMRFLDSRNFTPPSLDGLVEQCIDLKTRSAARRLIVVIDSLQAWRSSAGGFESRTDLDSDHWRIDQMRELRDAIGGDPVIALSAASRPSELDWAGDAAATIGSARAAAAADMVMLLRALSDDELAKLSDPGVKQGSEDLRRGGALREEQLAEGFEDQCLWILKGRDGVRRGRLDLRFILRQSRFEERHRAAPAGENSVDNSASLDDQFPDAPPAAAPKSKGR